MTDQRARRNVIELSMFRALARFLVDGEHAIIAFICVGIAALAMRVAGIEQEALEVLWTAFSFAGLLYHIDQQRETNRDKAALLAGEPPIDELDVEAVNNTLRMQRLRMIAKACFGLAGLIVMLLPPRVNETIDLWRQIVVMLLMFGVIALDTDAVLSARSRRRQIQIIDERRMRQQLVEIAPELVEAIDERRGRKGE